MASSVGSSGGSWVIRHRKHRRPCNRLRLHRAAAAVIRGVSAAIGIAAAIVGMGGVTIARGMERAHGVTGPAAAAAAATSCATLEIEMLIQSVLVASLAKAKGAATDAVLTDVRAMGIEAIGRAGRETAGVIVKPEAKGVTPHVKAVVRAMLGATDVSATSVPKVDVSVNRRVKATRRGPRVLRIRQQRLHLAQQRRVEAKLV